MPSDGARDKRLELRVRLLEEAAWRKMAGAQDLSLSAWIRKVCNAAAGKVRP